jgi:hypothetical protein
MAASAQTPLTNEERLAIENAQLRAVIADRDKADAQKAAQAVFEGACRRAKIDLPACQYDAKTQSVTKAEAAK